MSLNGRCREANTGPETDGPSSRKPYVVQSYRLCTYCGMNLDKHSNGVKSKKMNIKAHVALNRAQQICIDQGLQFDCEEGVCHSEFFSGLHVMNRVIASLEAHSYLVMPACHFFQAMNLEVLHHDASDDEKGDCYKLFLGEAAETFRKYRVVYLRGIRMPSSYQDLLPVLKTTYKDVSWRGINPPRSNLFSVAGLISDELKEKLDLEISVCLESIVRTYDDMKHCNAIK